MNNELQAEITLRESIRARMRLEALGVRKVAKQCELAPSSVHKFLSGKPVREAIPFKLSRWLKERQNGGTSSTIRTEDGDFLVTIRRIK